MFFSSRKQTPQELLEQAKDILAQDPDGARLLAIAKKHCVEIIQDSSLDMNAGRLSRNLLGKATVYVGEFSSIDDAVETIAHELRHLEQYIVFCGGEMNGCMTLKPSDIRLMTQIEEADAHAFSLSLVHRLVQKKVLEGRAKTRVPIEEKHLFWTNRKLLAAFNGRALIDVYKEIATEFRVRSLDHHYSRQTLHNIGSTEALGDKGWIDAGPDLLSRRIEDVFDMSASLPLPGGEGRITLQEMLDMAMKTIRPASYVAFAKMDKKYTPNRQATLAQGGPR